MLSVNGLTKTFGSGANKLQVLKGVDMNIKQGEMVALMGPSGSGKSTLLNIIGGLLATGPSPSPSEPTDSRDLQASSMFVESWLAGFSKISISSTT